MDVKSPAALLSLDAMKVFDRLEWPSLVSVPEAMGFDQGFIHMIKVFYILIHQKWFSQVKKTPWFPVARLFRQGCPLVVFAPDTRA